MQAYLKTSEMAHLIGRSSDFLKERIGSDFIEGVHYFRKYGVRDPFWKVEAVIAWIESDNESEIVNEILEKVS